MIKRIIPLISLWLLLACASKNQKETSLIELVPQNTSFVAQINDSISLKSSMELSKIFSLNSDLKKTVQNLRFLRSKDLDNLNIESKFIDGLRVTDEKTIKIVEEALLELNTEIISGLNNLQTNAQSVAPQKNNVIKIKPEKQELGFVGSPKKINSNILLGIIKEKKIPVIIPMGIGDDKKIYNINADVAANGELLVGEWGPLALLSANAYVFIFNMSWGPVMWVMLGEMFPNQIRGSGLAVSGLIQWLTNFAITWTFPMMLAGIGLAGAYGFYALCAVLSVIFVSKYVYETRGRELEDMKG